MRMRVFLVPKVSGPENGVLWYLCVARLQDPSCCLLRVLHFNSLLVSSSKLQDAIACGLSFLASPSVLPALGSCRSLSVVTSCSALCARFFFCSSLIPRHGNVHPGEVDTFQNQLPSSFLFCLRFRSNNARITYANKSALRRSSLSTVLR